MSGMEVLPKAGWAGAERSQVLLRKRAEGHRLRSHTAYRTAVRLVRTTLAF